MLPSRIPDPDPAQQLERYFLLPVRCPSAVDQPAVADDITSDLPLDREQPDRRWLVGADRLLELCDRGVSIRSDPTVRRHSRIALGPQLTQDDGLDYSPGSEYKPIRLELDPPTSSRFTCQHGNPLRVNVKHPVRAHVGCGRVA